MCGLSKKGELRELGAKLKKLKVNSTKEKIGNYGNECFSLIREVERVSALADLVQMIF